MAKKKVASVVVGALGKGKKVGTGTDPKVVTPTPGWAQDDVEFFSTHLPGADQRMTFSGQKTKTEKKPKIEAEK